jgi:outer membrane protein TolC
MRALGSLLLGYLGLAIACNCASAQTAAARPLSMKEAVQLAMQQNPQRLIARLAVNERHEDKTIAQSALLPQVNVVAGESVNSYNNQSIVGGPTPLRVGPFQAIDAGGEFSLNLFNMPLTRRFQASREDVHTAIFLETTEREQITALIVARYLGILRAAANRDAAASRVDLAQRLYDQALQLQKTGVGTDIDTLRAQVELQNEKQRLIDATTERNTEIYALAQTLALPHGQEPELTDAMEFYHVPDFAFEDLMQQALQDRPEMKAVQSAERAASLRTKAAGEQRLPSLQFSSLYDYQARKLDSGLGAYAYSFSLKMPLWTSGRISAEQQRARLQQEQISQSRRDLENAIEQQVKTALDQLNAAKQSVDVAELGLTLARQEVERARRRFESGVATNIEVITAQSDLARADDNRIQALYRFNQARADLARSNGHAEDTYGH